MGTMKLILASKWPQDHSLRSTFHRHRRVFVLVLSRTRSGIQLLKSSLNLLIGCTSVDEGRCPWNAMTWQNFSNNGDAGTLITNDKSKDFLWWCCRQCHETKTLLLICNDFICWCHTLQLRDKWSQDFLFVCLCKFGFAPESARLAQDAISSETTPS